MTKFPLPTIIGELVRARNKLQRHYRKSGLKFTFDGNLVGDLGEAIAEDRFGIKLSEVSGEGIDGKAPDGRTVQVKATVTGRGPAFRNIQTRAQHLLFFDLDLDNLTGNVVFNGPEKVALALLPDSWEGQRSLTRNQIREADKRVKPAQRLQIRDR